MKRGRGHKLVLTPEQIARYREGATIASLATAIPCTHSAVKRALLRQGVPPGSARKPRMQMTAKRLKRYAEVVRLRDLHKWPFIHIAEEMKISTSRAWEMYHTAKRRSLA